jgi:hypothetical protein
MPSVKIDVLRYRLRGIDNASLLVFSLQGRPNVLSQNLIRRLFLENNFKELGVSSGLFDESTYHTRRDTMGFGDIFMLLVTNKDLMHYRDPLTNREWLPVLFATP